MKKRYKQIARAYKMMGRTIPCVPRFIQFDFSGVFDEPDWLDLFVYGMMITKDGKRLDPLTVYRITQDTE
jgi:hypothetical protein